MLIKIKKIFCLLYKFTVLFPLWKSGHKSFTSKYIKYLRRLGINIKKPYYIDLTVWFDPANYEMIEIGNSVVISKDVRFLVHDYSICRGIEALGINMKKEYRYEDKIIIGNNVFIGLGVTLLPGTYIGDNCIIGTGSVVKGKYDNNSVIIGNPAKVVADTKDWAYNKIEKSEILKEYII